MALTIEDLARKANVSKMTVSMALRGTGRVAPATRDRIRQLAATLGYRPNASARAVSNGRHDCLALLMSAHVNRSYLPRDLLLGIERAVTSRDAHLLVTHLDDSQFEQPETLPRALREWSCDGFLLNYHFGIPEALVRHVEQYAIPAVWLNADLPHNSARHDDRAAGRIATEHLIALGHRRIVYVDADYEVARHDAPPLHYSRFERRQGYRDAVQAAGVPPDEFRDRLPLAVPEVVAALCDHFRDPASRPTAAVLHSTSSLPHWHEALGALGLHPADLAVIVVCDSSESPTWGIALLSTVQLQQAELGQTAVEMLGQRTVPGAPQLPNRIVLPRLVLCQTSTLPALSPNRPVGGGTTPRRPRRKQHGVTP